MTDRSGTRDPDETPEDPSLPTLDEPAVGAVKRSIEIVDPSPMLRRLIEIAQHLDEEDLRKLLLRARRLLRGKDG